MSSTPPTVYTMNTVKLPMTSYIRHTRLVASPMSRFPESLTWPNASSACPVFITKSQTGQVRSCGSSLYPAATKLKSFPKTGPLRRHFIPAGTVILLAVVGRSTRERSPSKNPEPRARRRVGNLHISQMNVHPRRMKTSSG